MPGWMIAGIVVACILAGAAIATSVWNALVRRKIKKAKLSFVITEKEGDFSASTLATWRMKDILLDLGMTLCTNVKLTPNITVECRLFLTSTKDYPLRQNQAGVLLTLRSVKGSRNYFLKFDKKCCKDSANGNTSDLPPLVFTPRSLAGLPRLIAKLI